MFIGSLRTNIFIPHSRSLKDKRRAIKSLKQSIRDNFNVSIAEKPSDKWQICELTVVYVNYTKKYVNEIIAKIENFIRSHNNVQLLDSEREIF